MKPRAMSFCVIARGPVACGVVSSMNFAAAPETGDTPGMAGKRLVRKSCAGTAGTTTERAIASTIDAKGHFKLRYFIADSPPERITVKRPYWNPRSGQSPPRRGSTSGFANTRSLRRTADNGAHRYGRRRDGRQPGPAFPPAAEGHRLADQAPGHHPQDEEQDQVPKAQRHCSRNRAEDEPRGHGRAVPGRRNP